MTSLRPALTRLLCICAVMGLVTAGIMLPFVGGIGLIARETTASFTGLPADLRTPPPPQRSRLLAADGSTIAEFFTENRVVVPLARISKQMQDAIVAVEDANFYDHGGVDVRGTVRALGADVGAGKTVQGGSTLTQQYVKNVLVTGARSKQEKEQARADTLSRKVREARYAIALEKKLTKQQILERYLNIVYFGEGAYGVEAAARRYFGMHASQLDLPRAALLAGLVQSPTAYDPLLHPQAAKERRDTVLQRMAEVGRADGTSVIAATKAPLRLRPQPPRDGCEQSTAPFFCDWVRSALLADPHLGRTSADRLRALMTGGLTVQTTLDPRAQRAAQQAVDSVVPRGGSVATAVDVVQPGTGAVLAMAVDRGFGSDVRKHETRVNLAIGGQAGFQAGSTFKMFTLAAAIAAHQPLSLTMASPPTITVDGFSDCNGGGFPPYPVKNAEDAEGGTFSMVRATWESVNTYFVQLERRTGVCAPWKLATAMGVRSVSGRPLPQVPSLTLGSADVSPLAVAGAYATLAARGTWCAPYAVTRTADVTGHRVSAAEPACKRVLDTDVADKVTSVLRGVIDGPDRARTGASASIGRPAAGKTGTTDGFTAAWFTGYTPQAAASVWVGDPRGGFAHPLRNVTVGGRTYSHVYGADLPASVWKQTMLGALADTPATNFAGAGASVATDNPSGGGRHRAPAAKPGPSVPPAPRPPGRPGKHHKH